MTYSNYDRIPLELTKEKIKHIKLLTDDLQIQCIHQKTRGELLDRIKNLLNELSFFEQQVILYGMEPVQDDKKWHKCASCGDEELIEK